MRQEAAQKIYRAKGRPSDNPLILHIADRMSLDKLVREVPVLSDKLMQAFWPGPLTLIFNKSDIVPLSTTGGLQTVAIRMPEHPVARLLIQTAGTPIAAPSANRSGRPSPTTAEHVREDLDGVIDLIIDGGQVGIGIESTIVDVTEDVPVILRPGHITKKMIEAVVGSVKIDPGLSADTKERPKAPGMKYRHYAPEAEMTIFKGEKNRVIKKINELVLKWPEEQVGILTTEENREDYPYGCVICMGSIKEETVAKELYSALREFDHKGVKVIYSESFSEGRDGEAVMNRLEKAAGQKIIYLS